MVITLSFLGLEEQTSSSLADDGKRHGKLHNSSQLCTEEGTKMTMVSLPFFSGVGRDEEVCGGGHGISSRGEEAIFFLSLRRREG